jgi:hypothetical protein
MAGIWLALYAIHRLRYIEEATVYSDSQLAISCIEGLATGGPKNLLKPIRRLIANIKDRSDCTGLSLKWCPSHRGNVGSILADKEARLAAKGEQYAHDLIPPGLAQYRRIITRHLVKARTKEENRAYALENWTSSPAGTKLLGRYPSVDPSLFIKNTAHLNRGQTTLLFRLVTGHVQLQKHLHTLRLVDSPTCEACGEAKESVSHFVLHCPKYMGIRQHILTTKGGQYLSLSYLFSSRSGLNALLEYVRRTRRLSIYLR